MTIDSAKKACKCGRTGTCGTCCCIGSEHLTGKLCPLCQHPEDSDKRVKYCDDCGRIKGIGCVCGLSFKERMKATNLVLPASFRAVKG